MGKRFHGIILILLIVLIVTNSCFRDPNPDLWKQYNLIAFLVKDTSGVCRIAIADYDYPEQYEYITPIGLNPFAPLFSPNKDMILIKEGDYQNGYFYYIYYFELDTLVKINTISGQNTITRDPVWNNDGSGIYFNDEQYGAQYYDLSTESVSALMLITGEGCFITSVKDTGELLIWSPLLANKNREGDNYYYYNLMSNDGEFISKLTNPYLLYTKWDDERIHHHETDVTWDIEKGKIIFSYSDSTIDHSCISVSDFDGTTKINYTSGEFIDYKPKFGPNNIIFFERYDVATKVTKSCMTNMRNNEIQDIKDIFNSIEEAEAIQFVDY
jgi:hypothetical protein